MIVDTPSQVLLASRVIKSGYWSGKRSCVSSVFFPKIVGYLGSCDWSMTASLNHYRLLDKWKLPNNSPTSSGNVNLLVLAGNIIIHKQLIPFGIIEDNIAPGYFYVYTCRGNYL